MEQNKVNQDRMQHFNPDRPDTREAGDEALSNLMDDPQPERSDVGYPTEERVNEDADVPNLPDGDEKPAGTGIPSKE